MIVNLNCEEIPTTTVFHFKNSLQRFILAELPYYATTIFVNLDSGECYTWEDVFSDNFEYLFYTDENDEDFLGVNTEF